MTSSPERRAESAITGWRRAVSPSRLDPLLRWFQSRSWDEGALLMSAGAVIGLAGGLGVVLFYLLIDASYQVFVVWPERHIHALTTILLWPLLTSLGLWCAWLLVRHGHTGEGQNVPDVQLAVAKRGGIIAPRPVMVRTLASAVTLASGGSAGSEGPVAVLGAAIGSLLGRALRFQSRNLKILVGCGAAAGIAGAFNAPFAGAFFALEEVLGSFSVGAFSPVVIASVVGALTSRTFLGEHPAFHMPVSGDAHPIANVLLYPLLGLACGAASALYVHLSAIAPRQFARLPGPPWMRPVVGGLIVGTIVALSSGILAGNGHLAIPQSVFGGMAWYALLAIALAKIVATAVTLGSGGSGGVFTPTLFIGAALGGGVGVMLQGIVPGNVIHPEAWALVGMAGMVAGATRAPLTAIFIVFELTNDSAYIIPLMIVAVIAFASSRRWSRYGLYDGWLAARGEYIAHGADQALLDRLHVADALDAQVERVAPDVALDEVAGAMGRSQRSAIPVVELDGSFVGLIDQHELREALMQRADAPGLILAEDLAEPLEPLHPTQSLRDALGAMNARGRDALPVTETDIESGQERFAGLLGRSDVLRVYERELEHAI